MRRAARWLVWPIVLGLLLWTAWSVDWPDVARRLAAIRPWQWLVLLAINAAIVLAFSGRWWAILRGMTVATAGWPGTPARMIARKGPATASRCNMGAWTR